MGRIARVIAVMPDAFGDSWDVRETRPTVHGWDLRVGWPSGQPRGRGGVGGPRIILTPDLVAYLEQHRHTPASLDLPINKGTRTRLRKVLGHDWHLDRPAWWAERADDLADLSGAAFAERHAVSAGAVSQAHRALYGRRVRPAGWWRNGDAAVLLRSTLPRAFVADALKLSLGAVSRLRWVLRQKSYPSTVVALSTHNHQESV